MRDTDLEELIDQLTVDEKAVLVAGRDLWHVPGVERLGIAPLKVTDGPNGARGARFGGIASLCFPCGTALGATWDPALVQEVGAATGDEARLKHAHVLLAPTVNLHRHPLAGRNFECYSEDPHLSARLAVAYISGVQSRGVGACVKHFVANDQEFERMTISSEVDERVLRELYLVPFEAAVHEAGAWAVMSAYNRLHGIYCSENPWLLDTLLKQEWAFDGVIMSDWFGQHSTAPAANAGLDLEMPGPPQWYGEKLAAAVTAGEVSEATVDDKVRRLLRLRDRTGERATNEAERSEDDPHRREVIRRAAAASFVLLQNDGLLPLDPNAIDTLAVIGPNADVAVIGGGGSATVTPHGPVTPLDGIRRRIADAGTTLRFERGTTISRTVPVMTAPRIERMKVAYYAGRERQGDPVLVEQSTRAYFVWLGSFSDAVPDDFSVEVTTTFVPDESGPWTFSLVQAGRARLRVDGEVVVDNWNPTERSEAFFGFGSAQATGVLDVVAGNTYEIAVEFIPAAPAMGGLTIGCRPPEPADMEQRALDLARAADAVVLVVGTDGEWESEGHDRESMELPGDQAAFIERVLEANARTAVIVNAASPVVMDWAERAAAVMQVWFPGEELGNALADVLFGDVAPSGRLPTTIPYRIEDTPAHDFYPGHDGKAEYGEGLLMGYRWYDSKGVAPRFAFGHGLSYTTFAYGTPNVSNATIAATATDIAVDITVPVTNTGTRAGAEVVQCYVHDVDTSVERPAHELKAFAKVTLEPGETRDVVLSLDRRAFAFWDPVARDWVVEPGVFEVGVGSSSRTIEHTVVLRCE